MARVNEGSRSFTCLPLPFIHEWNEPSRLNSSALLHHRTFAGTHFSVHKGQEAELAWVAGFTHRGGMPA